jgi:adenosylhomocysteine nucleosidase
MIKMTEKKGYNSFLLLGAFPQEIAAYEHLAQRAADGPHASGKRIIVETVGVSKPVAAANTQRLIDTHRPDALIFTGVAGALDSRLKIGDIGIGTCAIDADLDVRAWDSSYERGEVPFSRERLYFSDSGLEKAVKGSGVRTFKAYIATGSKFLDEAGKYAFKINVWPLLDNRSGKEKRTRLQHPNLYDMESSAVLQVANANNVPALVIRAVSDTAGGNVPKDFNSFVEKSVDCYLGIVEHLIRGC